MTKIIHIPPRFTYISNEIINKISNIDALGIYAYICSFMSDETVTIESLKSHFSCSEENIIKCLQYLKKLGVLDGEFE